MTEQVAAAVKPTTEIIRGRMPVAIVGLIRAKYAEVATKEIADKFGTTVGKVDDIKKNRNFAYVGADYAPSEVAKGEAIAWIKRHPKGEEAYKAIVDQIESLPVATAEQAAAFDAARIAARGQTGTTKDGQPVTDAGGGNRRKKEKVKVEGTSGTAAPKADKPKGEDLLA